MDVFNLRSGLTLVTSYRVMQSVKTEYEDMQVTSNILTDVGCTAHQQQTREARRYIGQN